MTSPDFADEIESMLAAIEVSNGHQIATAREGIRERVPLAFFDGFEPCTDEYLSTAPVDTSHYRSILDLKNVPPDALSKPLDVTFLANVGLKTWLDDPRAADPEWEPPLDVVANERDSDTYVYALHRARELPAKALRGKAVGVYPRMVEHSYAYLRRDGTYACQRLYAGWNGRWHHVPSTDAPAQNQRAPHYSVVAVRDSAFACSVGFVRRYTWRVMLGWSDRFRASFMTDPVGAQEAFRLRDVPNGKTRRAALRNWVTEHWRKRRTDPNAETRVRAHLRGATEFTWNGLSCRIVPSDFDAERAATDSISGGRDG
jgi:hypothetical protein